MVSAQLRFQLTKLGIERDASRSRTALTLSLNSGAAPHVHRDQPQNLTLCVAGVPRRDSRTYLEPLLLQQFLQGSLLPQAEGSSPPVHGGQAQGPPGWASWVFLRRGVSGFWEPSEHDELELK